MIPIKLTLEGFTSYKNKQEIDFTSFDVACISGANGAGKSSLLDAITYALYGKARKNDEAIINTASNKANVTLDFDYDQLRYRVSRSTTRGKGGQVDFFIFNPETGNWKVLNEARATDTNKKIEKTLRLDYETFVNASFFLQGKADSFAMKKPSERKQILSSILGLDEWESYRAAVAVRKRIKNTELVDNTARQGEARLEVEKEAQHKEDRARLEKDIASSQLYLKERELKFERQKAEAARLKNEYDKLERLKQSLAKAQAELEDLQDQRDERQSQLDACRAELAMADEIKAAHAAYLASRKNLEEFDTLQALVSPKQERERVLLSAIDKEKSLLENQLANLEKEEAAFQANEQKAETLEEQTQMLEAKLISLEKQLQRKPAIEEERLAFQEKNASLSAELKQIEIKGFELKDRIGKLNEVDSPSCPLCGQPLAEADLMNLIEELNKEKESLAQLYLQKQLEINQTKAQVADHSLEINELIGQEKDYHKAKTEVELAQSQLQTIAANREAWKSGRENELKLIRQRLADGLILPDHAAEAATLAAEIAGLGYDAAKHAALKAEVREAEPIVAKVNRLDLLAVEENNHLAVLADLKKRYEKGSKDREAIRAEHDELAAHLAAEDSSPGDMAETEAELQVAKDQETALIKQLGGVNQLLHNVGVQKARLKEMEAEAVEIRSQIGMLGQLDKAFGKDGVPALLIDNAIPELERKADEILKSLTNDSMTIRFLTQVEYKDSRREDKQETLAIQISDGSGLRDYETYSGGEAFRINFAIRLALSHVLAGRAHARLQTLVIDEGFGNQDAEGRDKLVQAINTVSKEFAKVLVITHLDELKDVFNTRLEVSKAPSGSEVRVVQV